MKREFSRALDDIDAQVTEMGCAMAPVEETSTDEALFRLRRPTPSGYDVSASLRVTEAGSSRVRLLMAFTTARQPFNRLEVSTEPGTHGGLHVAFGNGFHTNFLRQHRKALREVCRHRGALRVDGGHAELEAVLPSRTHLRRAVAAMIVLWRRLQPNGDPAGGEPRRPRAQQPRAMPKRKRPPAHDTPAAAEADRLLGWVDAATTPWSSTCERVRETIEARVQIELQAGAPLKGRLVIAFASVGTRLDKLGLRATLDVPSGDAALKLSPQRGFGGFIARWGEDVVGDDGVDDAYIIRLGGYPTPWLLAHRRELVALAPWGATVQQGASHLVINLDHLGTKADDVQPALIATLKLWERWVEQALGV